MAGMIKGQHVRLKEETVRRGGGRKMKAGTLGTVLAVRVVDQTSEALVKFKGFAWPYSLTQDELELL